MYPEAELLSKISVRQPFLPLMSHLVQPLSMTWSFEFIAETKVEPVHFVPPGHHQQEHLCREPMLNTERTLITVIWESSVMAHQL